MSADFDAFVSWIEHRPEWDHLGPVLRTAKGRAAFDVVAGEPASGQAGVRLPKNRAAVREFLALESASQISTDLWKRLGLPFEGFLRFGQLPVSVADANMKSLQRKLREALGEHDASSAPALPTLPPGWSWKEVFVGSLSPVREHDGYTYRIDPGEKGSFLALRRMGGAYDSIGPGGVVAARPHRFKTREAAVEAADALITKREEKQSTRQRPALWDRTARPAGWPEGVPWRGEPVAGYVSPSKAAGEADRAINDAITYFNAQNGGALGRWLPLLVEHAGVTRKLEYLLPEHGLPRIRWPGHYKYGDEQRPSWNLLRRQKDGAWVNERVPFIDRKPGEVFWGQAVDAATPVPAAPISAGLRIVKNGKILLVHPTNAPWKASYGIPKGMAEPGEELIDVALREVDEEIGVDFSDTFDGRPVPKPEKVENRDAAGNLLKTVYYWTVDGSRLPDEIPQRRLQLDEVDWAGFLDPKEAEDRISPYQRPLLTLPGEDTWEPTAADVGLDGKLIPILFWTQRWNPAQFAGRAAAVDPTRVQQVVDHLRSGKVVAQYRGDAYCRICGKALGDADVSDGRYVWPEGAEHYVTDHAVWISRFDDLVAEQQADRYLGRRELDMALRGPLAIDLPGFKRGEMGLPHSREVPDAKLATRQLLEERFGAAALAPYVAEYKRLMAGDPKWLAKQRRAMEGSRHQAFTDEEWAERVAHFQVEQEAMAYPFIAAMVRKDPPSILAAFDKSNPNWQSVARQWFGDHADAILAEARRAEQEFWAEEKKRRAAEKVGKAASEAASTIDRYRFVVNDKEISGPEFVALMRKANHLVLIKHTSPKIDYYVYMAGMGLWELDKTFGAALRAVAPDLTDAAVRAKTNVRWVERPTGLATTLGIHSWPTRYQWFDNKLDAHWATDGTGRVFMLGGLDAADRRRIERSGVNLATDAIKVVEIESAPAAAPVATPEPARPAPDKATFGDFDLFPEEEVDEERRSDALEHETATEKFARSFRYGDTRKFGSRTYKFLLDSHVTRLPHPDGTSMVWSRPAGFEPKLRHGGEMRSLASVLFVAPGEVEVWLAQADGHPDPAHVRLWAGAVDSSGVVTRTRTAEEPDEEEPDTSTLRRLKFYRFKGTSGWLSAEPPDSDNRWLAEYTFTDRGREAPRYLLPADPEDGWASVGRHELARDYALVDIQDVPAHVQRQAVARLAEAPDPQGAEEPDEAAQLDAELGAVRHLAYDDKRRGDAFAAATKYIEARLEALVEEHPDAMAEDTVAWILADELEALGLKNLRNRLLDGTWARERFLQQAYKRLAARQKRGEDKALRERFGSEYDALRAELTAARAARAEAIKREGDYQKNDPSFRMIGGVGKLQFGRRTAEARIAKAQMGIEALRKRMV